jgi:hypothetical protein
VTEVAPLLLLLKLPPPMARVAYTVFVVPIKLAPVAFAWNVYCRVAVGLICAFKLTPSITPRKGERPVQLLREGPGREGGGEGANLERDRLGHGIDSGRGAAQGELGTKVKDGRAVEIDGERGGAEGKERDARRRRHNAHGLRRNPLTGNVATTVLVAVRSTETEPGPAGCCTT